MLLACGFHALFLNGTLHIDAFFRIQPNRYRYDLIEDR